MTQEEKARAVRFVTTKRQSLSICAGERKFTTYQADEVEVFGMFGGDLPVMHLAVNRFSEKRWVTIFHNEPVDATKI